MGQKGMQKQRKIIVIIDCDISDRELRKCEVDDNALGSCGERADYCQWADWKERKITKRGKKWLEETNENKRT